MPYCHRCGVFHNPRKNHCSDCRTPLVRDRSASGPSGFPSSPRYWLLGRLCGIAVVGALIGIVEAPRFSRGIPESQVDPLQRATPTTPLTPYTSVGRTQEQTLLSPDIPSQPAIGTPSHPLTSPDIKVSASPIREKDHEEDQRMVELLTSPETVPAVEIRPVPKPAVERTPAEEARRHTDAGLDFSVSHPEGWKLRRTKRSTNYYRIAFASPGGEARAAADVMVGKRSEDAGASWERLSRRLARASGSRYRKIGIQDALLGGQRGSRWEFTLADRGGKTLRKIDVGTFHGNAGYAILCEAPVASFERWQPKFEAMIRSFRFISGD